MVKPNDVADRDALLARLSACEMRQDMLSRALAAANGQIVQLRDLIRSMEQEVRTRRLVVVDDTNVERIVAGVETHDASLAIRTGRYEATVKAHMVWVRHTDGGSAHLLATPDDAEVHVHCEPGQSPASTAMARATLHAMRGWRGRMPAGRASLDLAAGDTVNGWQTWS